jgi:hypothetical protein
MGAGTLLRPDDALPVLAGDGLPPVAQPRPETAEKPELLASATSEPLDELPTLPRKRGRPRLEECSKTLMATKPWLVLSMSRSRLERFGRQVLRSQVLRRGDEARTLDYRDAPPLVAYQRQLCPTVDWILGDGDHDASQRTLHGCDSMKSDQGPIPYCSRCERIDELTRVAVALGIKLTNADEGSELYAAWADRVREAEMHRQTMKRFVTGLPPEYCHAWQQMDAAIAEASRYAI